MTEPADSILIFANPKKPAVKAALDMLLPALKKYFVCAEFDISARDASPDPDGDYKMAVALGGDGAILAAARKMDGLDIPLVGVNVGKLGFMAQFSPEELIEDLAEVAAGSPRITSHMLLDCVVNSGGVSIDCSQAVNEVVISRGSLSRLIYLTLTINGEELTTYASDGLIVATPIGSTAHSLSSGGPIVPPDMEAILITPICPHTLSNRPLVVSGESVIEIVVSTMGITTGLTVDGQVYHELRDGDRLVVSRSKRRLKLVRREGRTVFETLRTKMQWKGHPDYAKG